MIQPDIYYEDKDILVCYKPAGIAVQTKRLGQQDMESILKNYRVQKKEAPYIGIVHRLDQPVEGIMVFAKNQKAAGNLSAQVRNREIGKYYYAVGRKRENGNSGSRSLKAKGTLTDYLGFDKKKNLGYVSNAADKNAKKAVLDYEVLQTGESDTVFFKITLHTGRHHQIRLQLAHLGYPLVGDVKYSGQVPAAEYGPEGKTSAGPALCSYRLEFKHPATGKQLDFQISPRGKIFDGMKTAADGMKSAADGMKTAADGM